MGDRKAEIGRSGKEHKRRRERRRLQALAATGSLDATLVICVRNVGDEVNGSDISHSIGGGNLCSSYIVLLLFAGLSNGHAI